MSLPDGVVTFLFTDVEGSTRLWEDAPEVMMRALGQHDDVIDTATDAHHGVSVKPRGEGDSRFIVFPSAADAVAAVAQIQVELSQVQWVTPRPLRVRMSLHTGHAELQLGDYYGPAVNRAARLRGIAHGGQVVISEPTWQLVQDHLPEGVTIEDMGRHGLKDLSRPEHVYQLNVEGLPADFPPLKSLDATPNNLPVQLTDFVGRHTELQQVRGIIQTDRFLTILAPGGTGKTRLAIQAAAELTSDFPDGVYFVDLAPIDNPDDIIQTVAEDLGIALASGQDPKDQLLAYFAAKTQLLVFDNFEHVSEGSQLIREILQSAPGVKVLATSRSKLNVVGEKVVTLSGLETDWDNTAEAMETSGAQLFVDASLRADASFQMADTDLEPLGQILHMVGGMPLGIELAAAWVDMLSVSDIASELANSVDFLESQAEGLPERQRSMRAVFDYTWRLLSEQDRRVFTDLSVFRGGFTKDAAEVVAGATLRDLGGLASKSLLVADRSTGRYVVHEMLRQYGQQELEADASRNAGTHHAHTAYYAGLAAQAEDLIYQSDQLQSLSIMDGDLDNMRTAFRQTLADHDPLTARQFIVALWFLHEIRGWNQAAVSLFREAMTAFADHDDQAAVNAYASAAAAQAWFLNFLGQTEQGARQGAEAAEALAQPLDLPAYVCAQEAHCAGMLWNNRFEDVIAESNKVAQIALDAGEDRFAGMIKPYAGIANLQLGNIEEARRIATEVKALLEPLGEFRTNWWNSMSLAIMAMISGQMDEAIELAKRQAETAREMAYTRARPQALMHLGDLATSLGNREDAMEALLEGLALAEEIGNATDMATTLIRIAKVQAEAEPHSSVAVVASVLANPVSSNWATFLSEPMSIAEFGQRVLDEIENDVDQDVYAEARQLGSVRPLETTAKEILAN